MKILAVHNFYLQAGGEDQSAAAEDALLRQNGHEVVNYDVHNREYLAERSLFSAGLRTVWNDASRCRIQAAIRRHRPDIVDVHNFFPAVSPAVYYAASAENVPVIQTLHNYRLTCVNAQLIREGRVCEECVGSIAPWRGVVHACYRDNRAASLAVAAMVGVHNLLHTWQTKITTYVALTNFAKALFVRAGLPADRIAVKPNFLPDPGIGPASGEYALFVGRLSDEKGVRILLDAWREVRHRLVIVGDGPMAKDVEAVAAANPNVEWRGSRSSAEVLDLMADARMLIFPSLWYEGLPRVLMEGFARGTPVVAAALGAMTELISHRDNGILFPVGDSAGLRDAVLSLWHDAHARNGLRQNGRKVYEQRFRPESNYADLMRIYENAISRKAASSQPKAMSPAVMNSETKAGELR